MVHLQENILEHFIYKKKYVPGWPWRMCQMFANIAKVLAKELLVSAWVHRYEKGEINLFIYIKYKYCYGMTL